MKSLLHILPFSFVMLLTSCGSLTHRDYLSEMEHDDSTFYRPNQDFPVVVGDSEYGHTMKHYRQRTPASADENENDRQRQVLKAELKRLESSQEESSYRMYEQHKEKIGSMSERIYYLKIPLHERRNYLESRGILEEPVVGSTFSEKYFGLRPSTIGIGMTKDDVVESFGKPVQVEVAGNPRNENERWLYNMNGSKKFIYFERGRVDGWD